MAINLDIRLRRADKTYREGESISGIVVIESNNDFKHDGITLTVEGSVNLQVSSKSVGIIEAFYNAIKPTQLINITCEVCGPGKLPSGQMEIPFEIPLQSKSNRLLYETYHGVFVNIAYAIKCELKRSFLSKGLQKTQQFIVQYRPGKSPSCDVKEACGPVVFRLTPETLVSGRSGAPDFLLRGLLHNVHCSIVKPFTGHLVLEKCAIPVRSIELQLVRVETCGCAEGYAKESTEIQNIQIGDGNVAHNVEIPIYMIFPRLFTCPTLITNNFKIEFEVNLVMVFQDDHLVTNSFPITLYREL